MKITQHIPRFVDTNEPRQIAEVQTTEELLELPWIRKLSENQKFTQFSVSTSHPGHNLLMVEYTDEYWVVGYLQINKGGKVNLPTFIKGDKKMKIRTGFVSNSSSTSYLIELPKDFNANQALSNKNINKLIKKTKSIWIQSNIECLKNKDHYLNTKELIEYLLETGYIKQDPDKQYDEDDHIAQFALLEVLREYIVDELEGGPDRPSWIVLLDTTRSTGSRDELIKKRQAKKIEKENAKIDPHYNSKDYPNETYMLTKNVRIKPQIKHLGQTNTNTNTNTNTDKRMVKRAPKTKK